LTTPLTTSKRITVIPWEPEIRYAVRVAKIAGVEGA